ncbi:MAG: glycoside hydrolase family 2 TIM barrel-domain containing protein [Rikenellaceae bacterium]
MCILTLKHYLYENFTKKLYNFFFILISLSFLSCQSNETYRESINISGQWQFAIDSVGVGESEKWYSSYLTDYVTLPGTTDENKKGRKNDNFEETRFLSRKYGYVGKAWYQKEVKIPSQWSGKEIELFLERTKPSKLWIDDNFVGENLSVSTPHIYNITKYLSDGNSHRITLMLDNADGVIPSNIFNSHINSEHTQTCWNGVVGELSLRAKNSVYIDNVKITPDVESKKIEVTLNISGVGSNSGDFAVTIAANGVGVNSQKLKNVSYKVDSNDNITLNYSMGENPALWDEFSPNLYRCRIALEVDGKEVDMVEKQFGMREFEAKGLFLYNNDKRVFLRGKHDGAAFPLTGYAPMNREEWAKYYTVCKDFGINHVRFHSWTPPIESIEVADSLGLYLQIEMPLWGTVTNKDFETVEYLKVEGQRILEDYASHPSVVMLSLGNELKGDTTKLEEVVKALKVHRPELLMATGTNNFLGRYMAHTADDFFATCRNGGDPTDKDYRTHTRASFSFVDAPDGGYLNNSYPNSETNFDSAIASSPVPIIGHETGQFQVYPDFSEIEKYVGVLEPRNLIKFEKKIDQAGFKAQKEQFFNASGQWQKRLYRADVEMNLRSNNISGFQLLDLQDYPGQGTALIGILDAFMDCKSYVTPAEWRAFCSPLTPLVSMPKFTYKSNEKFIGKALLFNYSEQGDFEKPYKWQLLAKDGSVIEKGEFNRKVEYGRVETVGNIEFTMPQTTVSTLLTLVVDCDNGEIPNSYSLWLYPENQTIKKEREGGYTLLQNVDNRLYSLLEKGEKVLLMPKKEALLGQTIKGMFMTDYWNYRMFRQIASFKGSGYSPGTLGLLIDNKNSALKGFVTDYFTDMQWYSIVKQSRPLIMNNLPHFEQPIVQVIDNIERNHRLSLIFECKVGKGKLLICMSDLLELKEYPEATALYSSLTDYVASDDFNPKNSYTTAEIKRLFSEKIVEIELEDLKNVSYDYSDVPIIE